MYTIDGLGMTVVCCIGALIVGLIALVIAIFRMKGERCGLHAAEALILISVVLCLAAGTRKTVLEIVESFQSERIELPLNQNKAVLKAYHQLNEELGRWFVMFVVLGSFFGLVIPIGSYLLQIKAVARKEEEFDARLKDEETRHRKEIERSDSALAVIRNEQTKLKGDTDHAVSMVVNKQQAFSNDVVSLWKAQALLAYERMDDAFHDAEENGWSYSRGCIKEIIRSLLVCLKFLEKTKCEDYVCKKIMTMSDMIKAFSSKTVDVDLEKWTKDFRRRPSESRIEIRKYCGGCEDSFEAVRTFLLKFRIEVLEPKTT